MGGGHRVVAGPEVTAAKVCPTCHQVIRSQRSVEISTRFQGWVTCITRRLNGQYTRDQVYVLVLLKACELETTDGASPYPYVIVRDQLHPKRTTNRSNKEMMQACWAAEVCAVEWGVAPLPEAGETT